MLDAHPGDIVSSPSRHQGASHHGRALPLRVGTRGSPLALTQTRMFLSLLGRFCPVLAPGLMHDQVFAQHVIRTTGDVVQDRSLAEIGGKGLFSKEIHESLLDGRIDFAVHSLKDLETELPSGLILACTLKREDARDALIRGPHCRAPVDGEPLSVLPPGALIGTNSLRRQAQLLHVRPDLRIALLRGNVQPKIAKVRRGDYDASLLALAGLRRLGLEEGQILPLDPDAIVPAAGQGIVGITIRADDQALFRLLASIEDPEARAVSIAERALLVSLDGSCRTPIGGYARLLPGADGGAPMLHLTGLVARPDGSFLLKRSLVGAAADAARLGAALGESLRRDSPRDIFTG